MDRLPGDDAGHRDQNDGRAIDAAIAEANRQWRAMGVTEADRRTLEAELRIELTAAAADGLTPTQLIGPDLPRFARDLATGAGVRLVRSDYRRLLLTALIGAAPGLVVSWLVLWQWRWLPFSFDPESIPQQLLLYAGCALLVLIGALLAARRGLATSPAIGRTVGTMAVLVPLAGGLATPVVMGFAALTDYSTSPPVLAAEAALMTGAVVAAVVLARRWALAPTLGRGFAVRSRRPRLSAG